MTITDIITLAKQGYKPADIKDLIELSNKQPGEQEIEKETDPDDAGDPEQEDDPEEQIDPEPDYKKMYEDIKKEMQRKNVRENSQNPEDDKTLDEKMADLIRSIY